MGVQTAQPDTRIEWDETLSLVRRYVTSRVGDRQLAEDITQDVFVRSIANGALDRVDNPVAWLIRSASNAIIDHAQPVSIVGPERLTHLLEHLPKTQPLLRGFGLGKMLREKHQAVEHRRNQEQRKLHLPVNLEHVVEHPA